MKKVRSLTRKNQHHTLANLLHQLNPVLRGWCTYFRHGVSTRTFSYVDRYHYTWWRIVAWIRTRRARPNWATMLHRHLPAWEIRDGDVTMFRPRQVPVTRYRHRGAHIATPWTSATMDATTASA